MDQELPLKFKRFGKTIKLNLQESQGSINSSTMSASVRNLKLEQGKLSQQAAKEQFIANKFSRPSQLIAPVDTIDYKREAQPNEQVRVALNKQFSETRSKIFL